LLRRKTQLNSRDIRHLYYFGFFKSLSVMALDPIEGIREEGCQLVTRVMPALRCMVQGKAKNRRGLALYLA